MRRSEQVYFHVDAALPFLATRLVSLLLSVGLYWCLLKAYQTMAGSPAPMIFQIISPLVIVAALEYCLTLTKSSSASLDAHLYWRLVWLVRLPRYWIARFGRKLIHTIFSAISIWAAFEIPRYVLAGSGEASVPGRIGNDLAMAGLSLAVGILAIFFTVVGLVVQSTMQDYSPSFLSVIKWNKTYVTFAVLSLGIGALNLVILNRGLTPSLARASFVGSMYCIMSVPFLIYETLYFLDVSNVIRKIADDAVRFARKSIESQPPILSGDPPDNSVPIIPVAKQWRMFLEKWVLGSMRMGTALPKFDVPNEIVSTLEEKVRPITSTCLKAIALDRREVVRACLGSLSYVTDSYVRARESYEGSPDPFLLFVNGQVEIIFNAALSSPNQQYTSDVTDTVADFAASSLALTKARGGGYPENPHVAVFSGLLEKIPIRSFHLEHSEAPMKACRMIGEIGNRLLRLEAYQPVLFTISGNLATIGRFCAVRPGPWAALLSQAAVSAFASLLHTSLLQALKTGHHYDIACKVLLENLEAIMSVWHENDHGHMNNQTVIAPLVGGLWQGPKLPRIYADVLRRTIPDRAILGILEDLEKIAWQVGALGQRAIANNRTPQYDFFYAFSEMAYEAIRFAASSSEQEISDEVDKFLENTISPAGYLIAECYKNPSYHAFNDLFAVSAIWAFLIYYYQQSKRQSILNLYVKTLDQLMTTDRKAVDSLAKDDYRLTELYKYIKLFGAWLYRFMPYHPFNKEVFLFLARNHIQQRLHRGRPIESEMDYLGYPTEHIGLSWYIHPSGHWADQQWPVTNELNDLASYKLFDKLVRHIAIRLGTYVEIVSRPLI